MILRALAAALVVAAVPHLALAEPAVIRVFEAPARAEPAGDAEVLQVLVEKTEVSVSEQASDGWRRVRLADGRVGWIEESALGFPSRSAVPTAPAVAPAPADLRARIYVKDLGHLSELVRGDPEVSPSARRLANRRSASRAILVVGGVASVALIGMGASRFGEGPEPGDPDFMRPTGGDKMFIGGVVGALATAGVAALVYPRRGELLDVINAWNTRHPDQPFEIASGQVGR